MPHHDIERFIADLADTEAPRHAINPWDHSLPGNAIRRANLVSYLAAMRERAPRALLVGEAPGYRGCGRVGMPFSSEALVLQHPFFADGSAFAIENADSPMAEASASIVWKAFDALGFYPLMWATYPFHPHEPGNLLTNRAPRPDEVALGREFLERMLALFPVEHVVAVGRVAERSLAGMGIAATAVRHPSHGGATLFAQGLATFAKDRGLA